MAEWHGNLSTPAPETRAFYDVLKGILAQYAGRITVRQTFYQTVARNLLPNTHASYKKVGSALDWLRKSGEVDFSAIEDRGRSITRWQVFADPDEARAQMRDQYDEDRWDTQERRIAVLVEKAALAGIIEPVCMRWQVPFVAVRGYSSTSLAAEVADDLYGFEVLYFGDHDPSGHDMARDWSDRLGWLGFQADVDVTHCALLPAQVAQYALPPQPVKPKDSRSRGYQALHGDDVYELDALPPNVLEQIVETNITARLDMAAWRARDAMIEQNRLTL